MMYAARFINRFFNQISELSVFLVPENESNNAINNAIKLCY